MIRKNNSTLMRSSEKIMTQNINNVAWFFYRSKYAGCAAFTFALFLVISQFKPEICIFSKNDFFGETCPLRFGLFISLFSSLLWFAIHIAATTYEQLGDKALGYLNKYPFKFLWTIILVLAMLGSAFSVFFFVAYFSLLTAKLFFLGFMLCLILVIVHHSFAEKFTKSQS